MKTNTTVKSPERELFGTIIRQNTKDGGMLSVSDLQSAYNFARFQNGWNEKNITMIMKTKDFQERCYHLLFERGLIKLNILSFMEMTEKEGVLKVLKGLKIWKTSGRGENKSTFCDPYVWVLLAMELNPKIYAKVVIWLTDKLIFNRISAGTEFTPMMSAIKSVIPNPRYQEYCKLINTKIFARHESGIRDKATQEELYLITELERFIIQSIEMGIIQNETHLINVITKYKIRNNLTIS